MDKIKRALTLPMTKVGGFSDYAQPIGSRWRLKVLPEPIKRLLSFSGLDFTQEPNFCNHQSKLLKNCDRQTLSLFHFFRLMPTHIVNMVTHFRRSVKPDSSPALKCRVFSGGFMRRLPWWVVYILMVAVLVPSYLFARQEMIGYEGYYISIVSPVTLNLILLYGIWGYESHRLTKKRSRLVNWAVFLGGCAVLTLFFRFVGGIPTVFG